MDFRGAARPLDAADVVKASKLLKVSQHVIWAIRKVESAGKAFRNSRPIIAWEAHIFHDRLSDSDRADAIAAGLAHPQWRGVPYLSSQKDRYGQIGRALEIDAEAALMSASWGAYQIMGFNYKRCGFDDVFTFVEAMCESEGQQLVAMANFIKSDRKMWQALKRGDWHGFARRYNGPGYTKTRWVEKLMDWLAHFKAKDLEDEAARIEREPEDPHGAGRESREAAKDGGKLAISLTALLAMAGEWFANLHIALDDAIEKLSGVKGMAGWVEGALVVLVSLSAASLFVHIMRRQTAKKEAENVDSQ